MLPAVHLCLQQEMDLTLLAVLLAVAMLASGVYHLCDSDVVCLAGLSFHSLQVRDYTTAVLSIFTHKIASMGGDGDES